MAALANFDLFISEPLATPVATVDPVQAFSDAMIRAGLTAPRDIVANGQIQRFATGERKGNTNGWYILHLDGATPAGLFGCWQSGLESKWCAKDTNSLTPTERKAHKQRIDAMNAKRRAALQIERDDAAIKAQGVWDAATPCPVDHAYLVAKGVQPHGARIDANGAMILPMTNIATGTLCSIQSIYANGSKYFLEKGEKGAGFLFGEVETNKPLVICEGFATGASIKEATGLTVILAFDSGSLLKVAKAMRAKYPEAIIIIAGDDDWKTAGNPGKTKSKEAAMAIGGAVVLPLFGVDRGIKDTDFNDLFKASGGDYVAALFSEFTSTSVNSEVTEVTEVTALINNGFSVTPTIIHEVTEVTKQAESGENLIPGLDARPQYVVFDDWHNEGGTKYKPGVWYFGAKPGKDGEPPTLTQQWVCGPLHIDAVTTDQHQNNFGRLIRLRTTLGRWRTWAMPMNMLRGDGSDLRGEFYSMGLDMDSHGRQGLASYLHKTPPNRRIQCVMQTGWAVGTDFKAFVLPDSVIGPKADSVVYQSGEGACEEYAPGGTLEGWQGGAAAMAVGNPLLTLGLCAAFAGPVLARCGAEAGGMHFIGDSSTGKTTILEAACSVWGGPNFKRTWRTTGNGLEGVATLFNDSLLALDEISECDPREVGEVVYMLGNGRGKQRAHRTGSARALSRWTSSVLSTGERSIETTMIEGGHAIKAGQSVRLLDIPAKRAHGAWDALHNHSSGSEFSNALKRAAAAHYGHAGRAFLEKLTRDHDDFGAALDAMKARPELQTSGEDGQAKRAAGRFAVFALAGELATSYGVTGWPVGEAIKAAGVGFAAWQSLRGGKEKGNAESGQIVDKLTNFIERHGDSRFSDADINEDDRIHAMVRDRAGWWRNEGDSGRVYLFTGEGLREALKGFDFNRALDALQLAGMIDKPNADGKRAKNHRITGRVVKVYAVNPTAETP